MSNEVFEAHDNLKAGITNLLFEWTNQFLGPGSPLYPSGAYIMLSCLYESVGEVESQLKRRMPLTMYQKQEVGDIIDNWYLSFVGHMEHDKVKFELARDDLKSALLGSDWGYQ